MSGGTMMLHQAHDTRTEQTLRALTTMLVWLRTRGMEVVEAGLFAFLTIYASTFTAALLFESNPSYRVMARISAWVQARTGIGGPDEGPWATLLWALVALFAAAYAVNFWGVWLAVTEGGSYGSDADYWQFRLAWKLRMVGLVLGGSWWVFLAVMFWLAQPLGAGWRVTAVFVAFDALAVLRLAFGHGADALPFPFRRWARGGRGDAS